MALVLANRLKFFETNGTFATKGLALRVLAPENLLTVKSKRTEAFYFDNVMRHISFRRRAYNFFRTLPSV